MDAPTADLKGGTVHFDGNVLNAMQMACIIKAQARFRGLLTRKKVKAMYGFECSDGLMKKRPGNTVG
jgi:hypothetical protein